MRSKDVRKTKLIRHYPGADVTFVLELTLYGKFLEIDRPLFFRRMHDQASSSMKSSPSKLQAYVAPSGKKQHFSPRLQVLSDKVVRVLRGPLSIAERFQLLYLLVGGMVYSYLISINRAVMQRHREL
jgi:hypothetical protein